MVKLSDYISTYAQKCALPVLFLALGTRMYTQITETMEFELRKSEQPRPGDVLLVGAVAGVSDELAVRLAAEMEESAARASSEPRPEVVARGGGQEPEDPDPSPERSWRGRMCQSNPIS